jgi:hypothetical protein
MFFPTRPVGLSPCAAARTFALFLFTSSQELSFLLLILLRQEYIILFYFFKSFQETILNPISNEIQGLVTGHVTRRSKYLDQCNSTAALAQGCGRVYGGNGSMADRVSSTGWRLVLSFCMCTSFTVDDRSILHEPCILWCSRS